MDLKIAGKVALVTGGASGIGEACVRLLHDEGAKVIIADLDIMAGDKLAAELGERAAATQLDVTDPASCEAMVKFALATFGQLDIAVNNAGISTPLAPIVETSVAEWHKVTSVNLDGVFYCLRAEIPAMEKTGGSIINMASIMGAAARDGAAAYISAKHGVVGLTKTAAIEGAAQNIRVNAIGPGYVETPLLQKATLDHLEQIAALHPIGRLAQPAEIAAAVMFLASAASSFVTGAYYPVDGGYLAQ